MKKISANNIRDDDVEIMKSNGNRVSYDKWLVRYTGDFPEPSSTQDRSDRVEYIFIFLLSFSLSLMGLLHIKAKYEEKRWARADAEPIPANDDDSSVRKREIN